MNRQYLRLPAVALACAAVAFALFAFGSVLAWRLFPYPAGADELQRRVVWTYHVFGERGAQFFILAALGYVAGRLHHPSWRAGILAAILSGLLFQAIAISVYIVRFGFDAYRSSHSFWDTLISAVAFSGLFGFLAVRQQYRAERHSPSIRSSELPPAGAAGSRSP